jgi:transcriptional regulator with XRE-family HTH domain
LVTLKINQTGEFAMSMANVTIYLRYLRKRKNFSQSVLAEAMGISLRQVSRWERGGTDSVHSESLLRAMAFLGASYDHVQHLLHEDDLATEAIELLADDQLRKERSKNGSGAVPASAEAENTFVAVLPHTFGNIIPELQRISRRYVVGQPENSYQGNRHIHEADGSACCVVLVNKTPLQDVCSWHDPAQTDWGYFGRDPATLAETLVRWGAIFDSTRILAFSFLIPSPRYLPPDPIKATSGLVFLKCSKNISPQYQPKCSYTRLYGYAPDVRGDQK